MCIRDRYEAAELDGCTPNQMFWKITLPLIRPILVYVMITSMIGGLQMLSLIHISVRCLYQLRAGYPNKSRISGCAL